MAQTKSAQRRVRNSERKRVRNRSVISRLKTLEKNLDELIKAGKKDETATAFRSISSALDKAVKAGAVPRPTVNRKKSRLAARVAAGKK